MAQSLTPTTTARHRLKNHMVDIVAIVPFCDASVIAVWLYHSSQEKQLERNKDLFLLTVSEEFLLIMVGKAKQTDSVAAGPCDKLLT